MSGKDSSLDSPRGDQKMKCELIEFEAIGSLHSAKLAEAGIRTMHDLLRHCCDRRSRVSFARKTGISENLILGWANLADLMRITGAVSAYAKLLKAAEVSTISDLRAQTPERLESELARVNQIRRISPQLPTRIQLTEWVAHANAIKPFVSQR